MLPSMSSLRLCEEEVYQKELESEESFTPALHPVEVEVLETEEVPFMSLHLFEEEEAEQEELKSEEAPLMSSLRLFEEEEFEELDSEGVPFMSDLCVFEEEEFVKEKLEFEEEKAEEGLDYDDGDLDYDEEEEVVIDRKVNQQVVNLDDDDDLDYDEEEEDDDDDLDYDVDDDDQDFDEEEVEEIDRKWKQQVVELDDDDLDYDEEVEEIDRKGKQQVVIQAPPSPPPVLMPIFEGPMHLVLRFDRTLKLGGDEHSWWPGFFYVAAWIGPFAPRFFAEVAVPELHTHPWGVVTTLPLDIPLPLANLHIEMICHKAAAEDPGSSTGQAVVGRARLPLGDKTQRWDSMLHSVNLELYRPPSLPGIAGTIQLSLVVAPYDVIECYLRLMGNLY